MKKQAEVKGKRPNGQKKRVYATGRAKKIKGQKHKLAWINDNEEQLLRDRNRAMGGPEAVRGPQGILAYPEPGMGNAPDGPGMGYGGGAKGANAAAAGKGGGTGGGKGNANAGGGFGGGSDRGGGADRGGGNDRGNAGPAGGYGSGGRDNAESRGAAARGSDQSNTSAKGNLEGLGNRSSKSDMGVGNRDSLEGMGNPANKSDIGMGLGQIGQGLKEAPMDSIANAAARAALSAGGLLGQNISVDPISGMGMQAFSDATMGQSPFGGNSALGASSLDANAANAANAIAGIVGGQAPTGPTPGVSMNQQQSIADLVGVPTGPRTGLPGIQAPNSLAKTDLQQSIVNKDPFSPSSTHAMNNPPAPPTREPVAPPAHLMNPTPMKTRSVMPISRQAPSAFSPVAQVQVSPANAPGFPAAPDPNADMGVTAPSLNEMPGFMENTSTIPGNDFMGRFAPEAPPAIGNFNGRGGTPGGYGPEGGGDDRYTPATSGILEALSQASDPSYQLLQGQAPAQLSPYHKSLWEYIYNA